MRYTTSWTAGLTAGLAAALLAGGAIAQEFDLDALVAAAKAEPPTSVYAVTGKIVGTAEAFSAKYGLNVSGKKVNEAGQIDLLIREHQAGMATGSVSVGADVASIVTELMSQDIVENWVPGDVAEHLPQAARDPLVVVYDPHVWAYNSAAHESCPVSNVWELTEPSHSRLVAIMDPLDKPLYADWFNQLATLHDDKMAAAYAAHYGKPFDTASGSATEAWVKAFATNSPLVVDSAGIADAIGAPGQQKPFFGIVPAAKFRDNVDKDYQLAICDGMQPFAGWLYPGLGVIASGTKSPNTAKLFVHYLMTEEGIASQAVDGKVPADPRVKLPADEASGIGSRLDAMLVWDTANSQSDLDARQDWQDMWMMNLKR